MKVRSEVDDQKIRGGFYTPPNLVDSCLERVQELLAGQLRLRLLEPSAGDGEFIRRINVPGGPLDGAVSEVIAVELIDAEARKTRRVLRETGISGKVHNTSAIGWAVNGAAPVDAAVGNPPFVRYQFVTDEDRELIPKLADQMGISLQGVANLWIPVFLGALHKLRQGGAFAFVIPTEALTGCSARVARDWLRCNIEALRFDLFSPGSFPDVLQEVAVVSGRRAAPRSKGRVAFVEHGAGIQRWQHSIDDQARNWTRYLLLPRQLDAIESVAAAASAVELGDVATFEVSNVTGANDFFCADDAQLREWELEPWALPLLPRLRFAPGLAYRRADHEEVRRAGSKAWLIDFGKGPDPKSSQAARRYIALGENADLHRRYKCRIREPWYQIPRPQQGPLLLSKRSHRLPRVVQNSARVYTTDTIYRGSMRRESPLTARDLCAVFHNSLTLLSTEIEGRYFGGGVLELVPSEIRSILIPPAARFGEHLARLDRVYRHSINEEVVDATDEQLLARGTFDRDALQEVRLARRKLLERRLSRARRAPQETQLPNLELEAGS